MSTLSIEVLDPIKLPLVTRLYKQHYPSGKAKKDELTVVGYLNQQMAAVVRFRTIEHYRLLTGMLVIPEQRGEGFGHQLMAYCRADVLGENDYCFAYQHLEGFYSQHGFVSVEQDALPNSLKQLYLRYSNSGKKLIAMHYQA
tara:strand:+ start:22260 stop:22685 length:426 start_codon:yes stop_codon:yes gene_type:complete